MTQRVSQSELLPSSLPSTTIRLGDAVRTHRALVWLMVGGLVLRLALVAASASMPLQIADERHYAQLAANLLHIGEFTFEPGEPTSMRPPFYPAFVALLWGLSGVEDPQVVRATQIVFSLFVVLGTYLLTLRLFDRRTAIVAATIVCFYPSFLYAGMLVLTEVVFTSLVVFFVLLYIRVLDRPTAFAGAVMGGTLGLAALTRSVLWPFPIVLLPLLLFTVSGQIRRRATIAACCLVGFVAVVGPWSIRNTRLQHTFTVVDTMGGMNLLMGNYAHTPEDRIWDAVNMTGANSWEQEFKKRPEAIHWTVGQREKWAQREAVAYMLANPVTTARRSLIKFADFWGLERELAGALRHGAYHPPQWFAIVAVVSVFLAYPVIALSACLGVFRAAPKDRRTHALVLAIVLFVTAVHTIVYGHSRYHLPLLPFLAVYAAAAWSNRSRNAPSAAPRATAAACAVMVVLVAAWCRELFLRDAERVRALLQELL